ncbi:MAG: Coenzyme F420 hydrogenase/dehydrogenase, beta subunit C-terminal domain [Desulfobacter sp.]|nr:MAG: Coenzyme F420 hydrogenase/dehydrogenase, beta subunit C-terminal domain [Desulfobacter sp.]
MKSFFDLVQSVQKNGLCCNCMGCAVFCRAAGFNALGINSEGKPVYEKMENCFECGLCHAVCPALGEFDGDIKAQAGWTAPPGRILEAVIVGAAGPGEAPGALARLLIQLFDSRRIDGVVVTLPGGHVSLGASREKILAAVRPIPEDGAGRIRVEEKGNLDVLQPIVAGALTRVALVGAPCQIRALRKMQVLNLAPSHAIEICFGLFCSGEKYLAGCRYCSDFSSEFADISWGRVEGLQTGESTFIARTDAGQAMLTDCLAAGELVPPEGGGHGREAPAMAVKTVKSVSARKKARALRNLRSLKTRSVKVNI